MARDRLRLFFALCPPAPVRERLIELLHGLPPEAGRVVAAENLHLTLAFLGAVDRALLDPLRQGAAAIHCPGFGLRLSRTGLWRKSGIFWLAPEAPPPALITLASALRELAVELGIPLEERDYKPHLTLLRKARHAPELDFQPVDWAVRDFALVESVTGAQQPQYKVLTSHALVGPGSQS